MLTAGYEFYRGTYHGDKITAAEWPVLILSLIHI